MLEWEGGIADALRSGRRPRRHELVEPAGTIELGDTLAENGIGFVDAPVSGGIARADDRHARDDGRHERPGRARARRAGARGARRAVFPTGPLGSGHAMKALNNFVGATTYVITAEALAIGQHYGLRRRR